MEDLQDALEDAQYFNAMHKRGPRPTAAIEYPTDEQLKVWKEEHLRGILTLSFICSDNLGFYLFLKYCEAVGELPSALFIEATAAYKKLPAQMDDASRLEAYETMVKKFINPLRNPTAAANKNANASTGADASQALVAVASDGADG
eukprot:CAMPEP_0119498552 /NCGR_PEP_ID=MMETSP1344-20130328/21259_1 /TAXON_ID=236787 /ORGANISM="Florenciella parvula, Strain CCMP2471" /LENGTH=145 /DNA_ID=CAMNT_0007534437 /DNA_START=250 /DNA_END=685 /DNA_ORIENTATION=-